MNEIITIEQKQEIEQQSNTLTDQAKSLIIANEVDNNNATSILKDIKTMRVNVTNTFKPAVTSAKNAYDKARALRDKFLKPVADAELILRQKVGDFVQAENKRLADIAAKEAAEFEKQAKKAEKKAEKTGEPVSLPIQQAPIKTKVNTQAGISHTVRWSAEVTDIVALCKAVATGKVMQECILPNMTVLNKLAGLSKDKLKIPGVKAVSNVSTSVR